MNAFVNAAMWRNATATATAHIAFANAINLLRLQTHSLASRQRHRLLNQLRKTWLILDL
jgi:hypothetical protein